MVSDTTRNSKTDGTSTTVDDKIDDHVNSSSSIEIENYSVNHFNDSPGDYANFPAMQKTNQVPSNIRDKELNNNSDVNMYICIYMYIHIYRIIVI